MLSKYKTKFPHGIMFHRFHKKNNKLGQGSLSANQLKKIINFIGKKNINSPIEWAHKLENRLLKKNDLCLTFDDGLKSQIKTALPVLNKYKIKAFFFIPTFFLEKKIDYKELISFCAFSKFKNFDHFIDKFLSYYNFDDNFFIKKKDYLKFANKNKIIFNFYSKNDLRYRYIRDTHLPEKNFIKKIKKFFKSENISIKKVFNSIWLNKNDIKKLAQQGHTLGLHSHHHPANLKKLDYKSKIKEYKKNFLFLKQYTNQKIISMSHPLNSYDKQTLRILKKLNIKVGFRSNIHVDSDIKKINQTNLELAREDSTNILKQIKK
tara:strand:+ start:958 stop:1917 length:960 start_codon:yes stop_codon:yes gene_type:complete